jgi:hypothetical protein
MEQVFLGEDSSCAECERVLWGGEPAYCGSTRRPDCLTRCNGGLGCVTLCEACFRRLLDSILADVEGREPARP